MQNIAVYNNAIEKVYEYIAKNSINANVKIRRFIIGIYVYNRNIYQFFTCSV